LPAAVRCELIDGGSEALAQTLARDHCFKLRRSANARSCFLLPVPGRDRCTSGMKQMSIHLLQVPSVKSPSNNLAELFLKHSFIITSIFHTPWQIFSPRAQTATFVSFTTSVGDFAIGESWCRNSKQLRMALSTYPTRVAFVLFPRYGCNPRQGRAKPIFAAVSL